MLAPVDEHLSGVFAAGDAEEAFSELVDAVFLTDLVDKLLHL